MSCTERKANQSTSAEIQGRSKEAPRDVFSMWTVFGRQAHFEASCKFGNSFFVIIYIVCCICTLGTYYISDMVFW
jgi:hypothetical protein